jgi:[histone H3]-trimethyl-L-lysine4 demethylase
MDVLVATELESRRKIRESFPGIREIVLDDDLPSDDYYQCCVCKTYIYLSQLICPCTTNSACPSHVSEQCDCDLSSRQLRLRYNDSDLKELALKIADRAKIPESWSQKFNTVVNEYAKPPLRALRSLLSEAERIPYPLPEFASLKAFVERANEWVEEATGFVARKHQNRRKNEKVWRSGSRAQELEERDRLQRSPDYVYKLLDQADELGFEAAEIDLLREKAEAIEEFKDRANEALEERSLTLAEYTELIDEGKSLNIDLPALDTLERIADQLRWVEKATEMNDVFLSLTEVVDLMDEGIRCEISPEHELMKQLTVRRDKGQRWEEVAASYLAMESVPFEALEKLMEDSVDLSIHPETYEKVESIVLRTREATQHIAQLMANVSAPDFNDRPKLSEARKTLRAIDELPVKPIEALLFKKIVSRAEEWVKHGKRLFGKINASAQQLEDHLLYVSQRDEKVFDARDVFRDGTTPAAGQENDLEAKESEDGPYCICRSEPTGDMVECEKCNEW